jgi:hypothetical protein
MGRFSVDVTLSNNHDVHLAAEGTLAAEEIRQVQLCGL